MSKSRARTESLEDADRHVRLSFALTIGIREKLIAIFLFVKILPLILLAYIAWLALVSLGISSREISVNSSKEALTAMAVESIERTTTDTAQKVAEFLYQRDTDVTYLASACETLFAGENQQEVFEKLFSNFSEGKFGLIRRHGDWKVDEEHGMSWVQTDPYITPEKMGERSSNCENNDVINATSFTYRSPYGFGDHPNNFVRVPLYDEIALLDKNGMQIAKHISPNSTKKRFPFPEKLLDVSDSQNTFIKSERYFGELRGLGKGDIYVSDVIGAYVPTSFVGMYTPNYMASRRIDAKVAELEAATDKKITEMSWKLRVLSAELKNDEEAFNSHVDFTNKAARDEINRRLGTDKIWTIKTKSLRQVSEELKTLGFPELAEEIPNIPFAPEKEAYAGAENPLGMQFEGIIRWAKPVFNNDGELQGYVTFALNHDHILDMINHITPMPARFSELSDAFHGNYAFIWDYKCRNIVHPRHHSIVGYNPETGKPEIPWLESSLYNDMIKKGFKREDWQDYIATLTDYVPFAPNQEKESFIRNDGSQYSIGYTKSDIDPDKPDGVQVRVPTKVPARELTVAGFVGLDGRYLNNAPQCTGWMDLTEDGGSGSFYILWSGLYKPTTAAAIPYYTGQYSPEVQGNHRGFGFVTIGAGIDDFVKPAEQMGARLEAEVHEIIQQTTFRLAVTTVVLSIIVIFIAVWMASYLSHKLRWLIEGITKFRRGHRDFRFAVTVKDEFGHLAHSFDEMAENIVHSVHTPLVITDMDLNFIYANDKALEMFNTKFEQIIGQSYKTTSIYIYGSKYCPITALNEDRGMPEVLYLKQIDRYLQGTANYLTNEQGEKQGYIITSNDVTDLTLEQVKLQQAKEKAELASQHKSQFLARMSHELRTPMNAIIGINEMVQSKIGNIHTLDDQKELNDNLVHLRTSSQHLLLLLNDILETSNLESGSVTLVNNPLDLAVMLDELLADVKLKGAAKQLKFETHFEFTSIHLNTDGVRLNQVLSHLLANAVKYTPERGKVTFTVKEKDHRGGRVLMSFAVKDTGIGIPENQREIIFYPFEQVATDESKYTTGSGLGLVIIRKILELFGSQIVLRSEEGDGSEFSFDIWLREEAVSEAGKTDGSATRIVKGRFAGQKALVVDDVRLNRLVLVNLLQEAGFTVSEAKDGKECVDMFERSQEGTYDIIFMDVQMPVMNGWDAAKALRRLPRQDAQTIPIVAISANAFQEDVARSLESGMNAHYAKPIEKAVIPEMLETYCVPKN